MIRTLTDYQRGEGEHGFVPIRAGVDVAEVKKNLYGPSGNLLAYYRKHFSSETAFMDFVKEVITKPTGTALGGRLTWETI